MIKSYSKINCGLAPYISGCIKLDVLSALFRPEAGAHYAEIITEIRKVHL